MTLVIILVYTFLLDLGEYTFEQIEKITIFVVVFAILAQSIVSIFIFCGSVNALWVKLEKSRGQNFVKRVAIVYPESNQTGTRLGG